MFGGRCEEAIQFYQSKLGAKLDMMLRFDQSPDPVPPGMLQAGFETKVMHASITINGVPLMMSDGCDDKSSFAGFSLAMTAADEAAAHVAFNALADGGQVSMPLGPTFWSPCYGMVQDRFGLSWMVLVPGA